MIYSYWICDERKEKDQKDEESRKPCSVAAIKHIIRVFVASKPEIVGKRSIPCYLSANEQCPNMCGWSDRAVMHEIKPYSQSNQPTIMLDTVKSTRTTCSQTHVPRLYQTSE